MPPCTTSAIHVRRGGESDRGRFRHFVREAGRDHRGSGEFISGFQLLDLTLADGYLQIEWASDLNPVTSWPGLSASRRWL